MIRRLLRRLSGPHHDVVVAPRDADRTLYPVMIRVELDRDEVDYFTRVGMATGVSGPAALGAAVSQLLGAINQAREVERHNEVLH